MLDITQSVEIIEIMENYLSKVRPRPEIRNQVDIGYELMNQSVILNEIRPQWNNPGKMMRSGYAKATYVKANKNWKVYWKRADLIWHPYEPQPAVSSLKDFLKLVDEDKYACFKG